MSSSVVVESLWNRIQKNYLQQSCKLIDEETPDLITHSHFANFLAQKVHSLASAAKIPTLFFS